MIPTETWVLPRPRKNKYRGGFPLHFERKLWRLLNCPRLVLHPFGGAAEIGLRVDLNEDTNPDYIGDAHNMHWFEDNLFHFVILDPPYNEQQSKELYGTPKPRYKDYVSEAVRVCKIGGYVAIYHWVMTPRPKGTKFERRIVILTRVWHRPRVCCVYRKESIK
jgi:hypothetical protein